MSESPRLESATRLSAQGWWFLALALVMAQTPTGAAVLAEYRVALTHNDDPVLPPAVVAGGLTASPVHAVGGLVTAGINNGAVVFFAGSAWPADAFDTEAFEITLTRSGGSMLRLDSLQLRMNAAPPMTFRLAASNDGFLNTVG